MGGERGGQVHATEGLSAHLVVTGAVTPAPCLAHRFRGGRGAGLRLPHGE